MDDIPALHHILRFKSEVSRIYRILSSQHELRKWFMPSVIISKNIILDANKRSIHFQLVKAIPNQMLRYHWRPEDWSTNKGHSSLTYRITDHNHNRNTKDEGIQIDIVHDHWPNQFERDQQGEIWPKMIDGLSALINEDVHKPWWQNLPSNNVEQVLKLRQLRSEILKWCKEAKYSENRGFTNLCQRIDRENCWHFLKDERLTYKFDGKPILSFYPDMKINFHWAAIKQCSNYHFPLMMERLNVEQELSLDSQEPDQSLFAMEDFALSLLINWLDDLIQTFRSE